MKGSLILERELNETVVIEVGEIEIEVTVVKIGEKRIKLKFDADDEASILRKELTAK